MANVAEKKSEKGFKRISTELNIQLTETRKQFGR